MGHGSGADGSHRLSGCRSGYAHGYYPKSSPGGYVAPSVFIRLSKALDREIEGFFNNCLPDGICFLLKRDVDKIGQNILKKGIDSCFESLKEGFFFF